MAVVAPKMKPVQSDSPQQDTKLCQSQSVDGTQVSTPLHPITVKTAYSHSIDSKVLSEPNNKPPFVKPANEDNSSHGESDGKASVLAQRPPWANPGFPDPFGDSPWGGSTANKKEMFGTKSSTSVDAFSPRSVAPSNMSIDRTSNVSSYAKSAFVGASRISDPFDTARISSPQNTPGISSPSSKADQESLTTMQVDPFGMVEPVSPCESFADVFVRRKEDIDDEDEGDDRNIIEYQHPFENHRPLMSPVSEEGSSIVTSSTESKSVNKVMLKLSYLLLVKIH